MRSHQLRHGSWRAGPGNDNIWKLNPSFGGIWDASIRLWTGDTADEVGDEPVRTTDSESEGIHGQADVRAVFTVSLCLFQVSIQKWNNCNFYFSVLLCIWSLLPFTFANDSQCVCRCPTLSLTYRSLMSVVWQTYTNSHVMAISHIVVILHSHPYKAICKLMLL